MKNKNLRMIMNLQHFAESSSEPASGVEPTESEPTPQKTVEELMTELAKERAEKAKMKNSLDKSLSERANLTKQLRERMSAAELEAQAKQEAEEARVNRIKELETKLAFMDANARYMKLEGATEELAKEAAEAESVKDFGKLESVFKKIIENVKTKALSDFLASRPDIQAGSGTPDKYSAGIAKAQELAKNRTTAINYDNLKRYM